MRPPPVSPETLDPELRSVHDTIVKLMVLEQLWALRAHHS
jgi:hypothetical protein